MVWASYGTPQASPLIELLPQVAVQGLERLLGRPCPVIVRLAPDDRVQRVDDLAFRVAAHGAQLVGESPPDLLHRIAARPGEDLAALAGPVAAYVEGEEIEAVAYPADPALLPVERQAPFLRPYTELLPDFLRLLAAVAQCHKIVRVDNDGRAPGFHVAAGFIPDSRGFFHALQCDIQ